MQQSLVIADVFLLVLAIVLIGCWVVLVLCVLWRAVAAVIDVCRAKQWHTGAVAQRGINQEQATRVFCGGEWHMAQTQTLQLCWLD